MKRDFARLPTEQVNPRSARLDRMSERQIVDLICREDARIAVAVRRARSSIARGARLIVDRLGRGGRLFFVGAGTSGRLGILEAAEQPPTFNTEPRMVQAIMAGGRASVFRSREGAEDDPDDGARQVRARKVDDHDVVTGIAASGVTPFVHGALKEARKRGAGTILVTCGAPARVAEVTIAARVGPEVITGSTRLRAGTATKMILNALTVASMVRLGKVYGNLMVDLQPRSAKLAARSRRIVALLGGVSERRADRVLKAAGNRAKTAIVMLRRDCTRAEALRLLRRHGGFLRGALEC